MAELQPGDVAPEFTAETDTGEQLSLSDLRGKRVILYFYPKDDTPGCTTQACGFRDNYEVIEENNGVVIGVSPDGKDSHQAFKIKYDLPFSLIVDEDHAIADAYGVWGEKSMYGNKYMGVIRSHFIIDEQGKIAETHYKISPKKSIESALKSVQA